MVKKFSELVDIFFGGADAILSYGTQKFKTLAYGTFCISVAFVVLGAISLGLNQSIQSRWIDGIAIVLFGIPVLLWYAIAVPLFQIVDMALDIELRFVKNIVKSVGASGALLIVILMVTVRFPPTLVGLEIYGAILAILAALLMLGLRVRAKAIAFTMISTAIVPIVFAILPYTANGFMPNWSRVDTGIGESIFSLEEVEINQEALEGRTEQRFFAQDGRPMVWCAEDANAPSGYRCYDGPGSDPMTGDGLLPFSATIRTNALSAFNSNLVSVDVQPQLAASEESQIDLATIEFSPEQLNRMQHYCENYEHHDAKLEDVRLNGAELRATEAFLREMNDFERDIGRDYGIPYFRISADGSCASIFQTGMGL